MSTLLLLGVAEASDASAGVGSIDLGTSATYSVLGGQAVSNTGPTRLDGDLGLSPNSASSITGFPPGLVGGVTAAGNAPALQAQSDLTTAYNVAAGLAPTQNVGGDLVGSTKTAGVYKSSGPLALSGALTLDGQNNPDSVFVFQIASTLTTATASSVRLINGAQACHIFWQIGSSATLGTASVFRGTIMALTSVSVTNGVLVQGRALARNGSVTLDNDIFTSAQCSTATPLDETSTNQTLPSDPVSVGQTIPVRVTVSGSGVGVPTGTVTVFVNGVAVGSAPLDSNGRATVDVPAGTAAHTKTITTHYNGSVTQLPSNSAPGAVVIRAAAETSTPTTSASPTASASANAPSTSPRATTTSLAVASTRASTSTTTLAHTGASALRPLTALSGGLVALGMACSWIARRRVQGRHRS